MFWKKAQTSSMAAFVRKKYLGNGVPKSEPTASLNKTKAEFPKKSEKIGSKRAKNDWNEG